MMTGEEFGLALKSAGFNQTTFAEKMKVDRTVIGRQVRSEQVAVVWVYALAGLVAGKAATEVIKLVEEVDNASH